MWLLFYLNWITNIVQTQWHWKVLTEKALLYNEMFVYVEKNQPLKIISLSRVCLAVNYTSYMLRHVVSFLVIWVRFENNFNVMQIF